MIPIARPQMGEEEKQRVWEAMDSGMLAQGPRVAEFEERVRRDGGRGPRRRHQLGDDGTAPRAARLRHRSGRRGDHGAVHVHRQRQQHPLHGARPVLVDVREDDFTIDVDLVESAITSRTKAIMPVSLYGQPADLPALAAISERHGLAIVEDAAQSHGASIGSRRSGSWGAGAFSFYPTKNMTTGEGGMITTDDSDLAGRMRLLREHGMKVRYHHDVLGYNFRMTDLAAAIGVAQLPKLAGFNDRRRAIAARYDAELRGVVTPTVRAGVTHVYHQYTIRVAGRDAFAERLAERGVGSAIYYPIPVHRQKPFAALGYDEQRYPVTERLTDQVLSIPVHPSLTDDEVATVIGAVNQTAAELGQLEAAAAG